MLTALLLLALTLAVITDLRSRRIPNTISLPMAAFALVYHGVTGGWQGLWFSLEGFLLGLVLLLVPFALGWMGGGDVKLLAAVGAALGPQDVFVVALYMAVVGGVIAAAVLGKRRGVIALLHNLAVALRTIFIALVYGWKVAFPGPVAVAAAADDGGSGDPRSAWSGGGARAGDLTYPYAVAIGIGTLLVLWVDAL